MATSINRAPDNTPRRARGGSGRALLPSLDQRLDFDGQHAVRRQVQQALLLQVLNVRVRRVRASPRSVVSNASKGIAVHFGEDGVLSAEDQRPQPPAFYRVVRLHGFVQQRAIQRRMRRWITRQPRHQRLPLQIRHRRH